MGGRRWYCLTTAKMVINPTYLAQRTRSSASWSDAKTRVTKSYRDWLRASPEIQQMYSLNMPVSQIRTKIQQEFQETLNFWKQLTHVLKYFRAEEDPKARLPK